MSLKPVKSLGARYQAKIYKHYIGTEKLIITSEINKEVVLNNRPYLVFYASGTSYLFLGSYNIKTNESVATTIARSYITSDYYIPIEYNKIYPFLNPYDNKLYLVGYFQKEYQDWQLNTLEVRQVEILNINTNNLYNSKIYTHIVEDNYERYAKDKTLYYYLQAFNYIPIDDISETTSEHIKGNIMKEETRSIRWDYDNIPLEENDIVQLENGSYYIVQDILVKQRVGFNVYKTYTAMLYKVGV